MLLDRVIHFEQCPVIYETLFQVVDQPNFEQKVCAANTALATGLAPVGAETSVGIKLRSHICTALAFKGLIP